MRLRCLIATVVMCISVATPALAQQAPGLAAQMRTVLDEFRGRYGFPGATAAFVLADRSAGTAASGLADVEADRPMTPDSRMLAASIGKTFVAATVLALESEGRLSRQDRVADHLGDRTWFAALPNAADITIAQLLRHQSGLPDHPHLPAFAAAAAERIAAGGAAFSPEELLGFVLGEEPLFAAGDAWAYSDTGYILLGLVIEQVAGRPYYEIVEETFIGPLGLTSTRPSNRRDLEGLAVGYTVPGNPFGLPTRTADANGHLTWDPAVEWTGGGLVSTSRDLALWGHALFEGAALDTPYLARLLDAVAVAPDAPNICYGMGVAIHTGTPHGRVLGHGGWIPGYVSSLRHYADHGVTIAFQINTDAGVVDDASDLVPALEAALAELVIAELPLP